MNILQALRTLQPEHARLAAKQADAARNRGTITPAECDKLDRMNTAIRAACIRQAGLEAVRKELES